MNQTIIDLYDQFTHGGISRRRFLDRLAVLAGGTAAASAVLGLLQNNYRPGRDHSRGRQPDQDRDGHHRQHQHLCGQARQGASGGGDKFPAVIVIHENRGLNPHSRTSPAASPPQATSPSVSIC